MTLSGADRRVLVHGHRGARAVLPENTIPAFEYAINAGVDVLELDLAVTKDNVVVVSHDPRINSGICSGPREHAAIRELTLAELREYDCGSKKNPLFPKQKPVPGTRIPTLDEVFALVPRGTFGFNIETKIFRDAPELTPSPEDFVRLVLDSVRKHNLEKRVILQSFDFRTLHAMKKLAPEIPLSALYEGAPRDFADIAREAGAGIVSPRYPLVTREQVEKAHAAGLQVVPWTANTPEDWRKLIDAGVDAIITDDPAELIRYLKR
jgi:glycerophosphoryl diester phosphodiesterase